MQSSNVWRACWRLLSRACCWLILSILRCIAWAVLDPGQVRWMKAESLVDVFYPNITARGDVRLSDEQLQGRKL